MSADRAGVAVVGVGRIGRMHAEIVAQHLPDAALVAVADVVPATAAAVGDRFGAAVADIDGVLARVDVDAVAICSSTGTHVDLIVRAAEAGKAILCEKPVSLDLDEVDRAVAAVDTAGVPLMVGFNRRFDRAHQSVREAVAAGQVGDPHLALISSRDPALPPLEYLRTSGGLFLDMTIHDFDMARYVTGSDIVEVYADGAVRVDQRLADLGDIDTAAIVLRHVNGCLTVIDNSRQAAYGYDQRVEVFGSKGMAASENPRDHTGVVRTADGTRAGTLPYFFVERYYASYVREWAVFVEAVRKGSMPPVSVADGRAALVAGLAAQRSLRDRRPVLVAEVEHSVTGGTR